MHPRKVISGYPLLLGYVGYFLMMIGLITLLPLLTIIFYSSEVNDSQYFIVPGVISILIGYLLSMILRGKETAKLERHQDVLLIFLIWIVAIITSAFPFVLSGQYNFTQAIFESTSGYSTTGLTVVDVTTTSHTFLMFRSLMQFFGGVGLVLVLTSAISDKYGMKLYSAEGHNDKLLPNLAKSARLILTIYIAYIIVGSILYTIFGMSVFDSINHAIASVSTGGFSTQAASIGYYQSFPIEVITMVLMLLGSTNLVIHLFIFKAKYQHTFQHIEVKLFIVLTVIFVPIMTYSYMQSSGTDWWNSMRVGLFQYMSAITTTGFQTVDRFQALPHLMNYSVIILMIVGGGIGSTSGGIKQYRIALLLKSVYWNLRNKLSHQRTIHTNSIQKFGKTVTVSDEDIQNNHAFIAIYCMVLVIGTIAFSMYGYTLEESFFEFGSALGTVGLSIGVISYHTKPVLLWVTTFGMLIGRLEFYVVFIALFKLYVDLFKKKV
jgi:trk system potassium uptake protein TrkH